jgi:hypothetical protein
VKQAVFSGDVYPAVRQQKHQESLVKLCQMISGRATRAAAYLLSLLDGDESTNFLSRLLTWHDGYLEAKGTTFQEVRADKQLRRRVGRAA